MITSYRLLAGLTLHALICRIVTPGYVIINKLLTTYIWLHYLCLNVKVSGKGTACIPEGLTKALQIEIYIGEKRKIHGHWVA